MEIPIYTLEEIRTVLREEIRELSNSQEKLLTREEAADFLSISLPTLSEWTKHSKIKMSSYS